jgi:hypothetical protein
MIDVWLNPVKAWGESFHIDTPPFPGPGFVHGGFLGGNAICCDTKRCHFKYNQ